VVDATAAVGCALITSWARKLADGKMGPTASRFYFWLSTHAGVITGTVAALSGCLVVAAQMPELLALVGLNAAQVELWSVRLAYVWPVLISLKLATDRWHDIGADSWHAHPAAVWLKEHSAALTYLAGGAWWYAERCGAGGWCDVERWAVFVVGVVGANFGILPRAAQALPPAKVLEGLAGLVTAPTPAVAKQAEAIAALPDAPQAQNVLRAASHALDTNEPEIKAEAKVAVSVVAAQIEETIATKEA